MDLVELKLQEGKTILLLKSRDGLIDQIYPDTLALIRPKELYQVITHGDNCSILVLQEGALEDSVVDFNVHHTGRTTSKLSGEVDGVVFGEVVGKTSHE